MSRPRVFVSFSSRDRDLVRRLFARLEAQPVDLWNYADEAQEIPGGAEIADYLTERIDRSDYFLPLVSPNSFESNYARQEVHHALAPPASAGPRIVPLVLPECPMDRPWPEPYRTLESRRYRMVDFSSIAALEETVVALCKDMHVRYLPLLSTDPRLPFMDRFVAEVEGTCPRRNERDIAVYTRLMAVLSEFQEAFEAGDFPRALARISYFVLSCEYEFVQERFYYPYVVKAVCEIACGQLLNATATLEALKDHPHLDENVFGALGYIQQQHGMYREALACYREAVRRAPADPAAKAGEVMNAILCGEPIDIDQAFRDIERGPILVDEDRVKVRALKAFALARAGRLSDAEAEFAALVREGHADASVLANFADVLVNQGRQRQARDLLQRFHKDFDDDNLLHHLASLSFQIGDTRDALRYFADLVKRCPNVRQYRIDAAQAYWHAGDRGQAKKLCAPLLDPSEFPLPRTADDFFRDGFANYFLGDRDRADYDFERSGMDPKKHYRHLV